MKNIPDVLFVLQVGLSEPINLFEGSFDELNNAEEDKKKTDFAVTKEYFKAAKNVCVLVILIMMIFGAQLFLSAADVWVAFW